ncbi:unnamed protein product [Hermetia illucens]|uniref:mRNA cap guanine-N(7) methyltransferase n=1 Tax=Hermetia illucens TaxID=343691 RepID=A0A7R8Z1N7_HERIL|nr:mRNA cap guanine-N7 methyltransferase [Hermetia illucens]CAD7089911.1 unnamed protein product [Hermetia illucens]
MSDEYEESAVNSDDDNNTDSPAQANVENESDSDAESEPAVKRPKVEDHTKLVATHYNEIEEKGLAERSQSRIVFMRNFNNWIKSMLINEYLNKLKASQKLGSPLRVLDMCCGKGGDLLKWEKGGITHLICTDIADVSLEQCESRYKKLNNRFDNRFGKVFTAEFFACDSTLVRLRERYKDPSMELHLVSCQFAFHYCFESMGQAECMIRNAAECLAPDGYFIATIPDANEIMRRQRQAGNRSFGNDVYNIEFICDTEKPPLFGAKYKFKLEGVVDCPEFLVHFPTLVKLCKKYGLKLESKVGFADYFQKSLPDGKGLLSRMQALETYPAQKNAKLVGKDEDYAHAQEYLGQNSKGDRFKVVGTLSKPEWEVATLYLVCAFRKCKTMWDAEGKPVYDC